MRTCEIQTGPNKFRTVWIVSGKERRAYVRLARKLARLERQLAEREGVASVAHGFVTGRSPVTMASAHIGYDVTVSLDLSNWFESVTQQQLVDAGVPESRASRCCPGGVVRQGLPSSPAAANIAGVELDRSIWVGFGCFGGRVAYTRYADDLVISARLLNTVWRWQDAVSLVQSCLEPFGWALNERKTRVQYASAGRRIICGLSVGETDVRATRSVRHRLRACQHARPGTNQTRGLQEWAACKLPGSGASRGPVTRTLSRGD